MNDDRNLSASSSTSVEASVPAKVTANLAQQPSANSAPQPSKFGAIGFDARPKRPTRVDNEAKAELDRYADALAATRDANGVVVAYATAKEESGVRNVAAQRSVNTKDYLNKEKGVDPARIEVRTGSGDDQKAELWMVPAGATFTAADTKAVDEAKVKAVPRLPLKARKRHKKTHRSAKFHHPQGAHTTCAPCRRRNGRIAPGAGQRSSVS